MSKKIIKPVTGYCDYFEEERTIHVEYVEYFLLSMSSPGLRATGYKCPDSYACQHECPIYEQINQV